MCWTDVSISYNTVHYYLTTKTRQHQSRVLIRKQTHTHTRLWTNAFLLCGFPVGRPSPSSSSWRRNNGNDTFLFFWSFLWKTAYHFGLICISLFHQTPEHLLFIESPPSSKWLTRSLVRSRACVCTPCSASQSSRSRQTRCAKYSSAKQLNGECAAWKCVSRLKVNRTTLPFEIDLLDYWDFHWRCRTSPSTSKS